MSARDEHLFGIIYGATDKPDWAVSEVHDAILAAGYSKPRTITTAEELDALPDGSAILDRHGDVSTKHAHWWHGYETAPLLSRKVAKYGPLTVIHEGA